MNLEKLTELIYEGRKTPRQTTLKICNQFENVRLDDVLDILQAYKDRGYTKLLETATSIQNLESTTQKQSYQSDRVGDSEYMYVVNPDDLKAFYIPQPNLAGKKVEPSVALCFDLDPSCFTTNDYGLILGKIKTAYSFIIWNDVCTYDYCNKKLYFNPDTVNFDIKFDMTKPHTKHIVFLDIAKNFSPVILGYIDLSNVAIPEYTKTLKLNLMNGITV